MAAITYRAPRGQAQQSRLAQQALPMNQRGQVDTGDPDDAHLIEAKRQAVIDQIEAVRNASTRRGASSSGSNPPPNPPSKPRPTKKTISKTRISKKTPANQTAYGGARNQNFPEPNQLNEDEKQAIRFARLAASRNRKMDDHE